jgi:serine/threonine-protein phosphatase 4 regulatory subunit 4
MQATRILPALKASVRLPEDVELLERLNSALSNTMTDDDRDVSLTARSVNDTYKRTPVRMGGAAVTSMGGGAAAFEAADKRKEEEEAGLGFTLEDAKE